MLKRKAGQDRALENIIANYNAIHIGLTASGFIEDIAKKASDGINDPEGYMKQRIKKSTAGTERAIYEMLCKIRDVLYGSGLEDVIPAQLLSDGFEIASKCNVKDLAKLDSELDKESLLKYIRLAKAKDKEVDGVMAELEPWNNNVRKLFPPLNLLVIYATPSPQPEKVR